MVWGLNISDISDILDVIFFLKAETFLMVADVAEGEEICINYVAFIHGTYLRRQKLQEGTAILRNWNKREQPEWNSTYPSPPPPYPGHFKHEGKSRLCGSEQQLYILQPSLESVWSDSYYHQ